MINDTIYFGLACRYRQPISRWIIHLQDITKWKSWYDIKCGIEFEPLFELQSQQKKKMV